MVPPATGSDTAQSNNGGKVKKARKRPNRGGCIACSKRRQKCDRAQPCSSCVSKGSQTPHPCKPDAPSPNWSPQDKTTDGYVNEVPSVLRTAKLGLDENRETLKMLSEKIQSLESRVVSSASQEPGSVTMGPSRFSVPLVAAGYGQVEEAYQSTPDPSVGGVSSLIGDHDYGIATAPMLTESMPLHSVSPRASVISSPMQSPRAHAHVMPRASRKRSDITPQDNPLAQLIPFVQSGEFVGRATIPSTIHLICSSTPFWLPHAASTVSTSGSSSHITSSVHTLIPTAEIQHLIQYLPNMQSGNLIIDSFLKGVNWRYGFPEMWLTNSWTSLLQNLPQNHKINPHWLTLFFSIFACTPQPPEGSSSNARLLNMEDNDTYHLCASTARRIAEDDYFSSSNAISMTGGTSLVDGCILGCLAIPLLCDFLAAKGRVCEAWKLMGAGIRDAQSIGLHRDPDSSVWREMSEEEKYLRRSAWWGLYIWDRLLSYILGRPQIIRKTDCDVVKPSIVDTKGKKDISLFSRFVMVQLSDFVSEILDKCMGITHATWTDLAEIDSKFETWELSIPAEFRTQEQDILAFAHLSPSELQTLNRHRYMITTWCHLARLKFYILVIEYHQSQMLLSTKSQMESPGLLPDRVAEKCALLALELIKFQCDAFEKMRGPTSGENWLAGNWYFEGCLSLFEAAVALLLTVTKYPTMHLGPTVVQMGPRSKYEELTRAISRAIDVFSQIDMIEKDITSWRNIIRQERGIGTASKALYVLQMLLRENWWKLDPRAEQGGLLRYPSMPSSYQRTETNESAVELESVVSFGGDVYDVSSNAPQQHAWTGFQSPVQIDSGFISPASIEDKSLMTMQPPSQTRVYPIAHGSTAQYSMRFGSYSPPQPLFKDSPLLIRDSSYSRYIINQDSETIAETEPPKIVHSTPYDYQPQDLFSIPSSSQSSDQGWSDLSQHQSQSTQDQSWQQVYLQEPQPLMDPTFSSAQFSPSQFNSVGGAFAHNQPVSTVGSARSDNGGGRPSMGAARVRSRPNIPPPSQGIRIIQYVAPGSQNTSTTATSGMNPRMSSSLGDDMSRISLSQGPRSSQQGQMQLQDSRTVSMNRPPPLSGD